MNSELTPQIDALARVPVLLVATDFDGTIAPIVQDPARAEADREALVALKALAAMPQTHVAIISGRSLSDLAGRTHDVDDAHLVGSHGSEFEADFPTPLLLETKALLDRLGAFLRGLVAETAGLALEEKPAAYALHYRNADAHASDAAIAAVFQGPAKWAGVHCQHGKKVIELSVVAMNKGTALNRIRQRVGATAVLFIGDDVTDEAAFATLGGPDVGIKIGPEESLARFRAEGTPDVARVLAALSERRSDWVAGSHATPIQQHSLLSDQRTIAMVDPRARVIWMCLPRIDSAAIFAELLGGPTAGFFEISPVCPDNAPKQRYIGNTFMLETAWPSVRVTDYLDCGGGRPFQRAGRTDLIRVIEGSGRVRIVFAPRLDFGRIETRMAVVEGGIVVEGSIDAMVLHAPGLPWRLELEGRHQSAVAEFELPGEPVVIEFRYGTASLEPSSQPERQRRERSERFWSDWAATLSLPSFAREQVMRSALVLKALCYGPTGAIAAAGTTSLPEHAGGVRNWDYRFCWPRDAAMSAKALALLGTNGPALKLLDWLLGILDRSEPGTFLSPVYTITGGHLGPEGEVGELHGYRGSRPVRIGNAAAQQIQLDVFGPIVDLVAMLAKQGAALSSEHWRMVDSMVSAIEGRWQEPDHGIWEVRRPRKHHVHSRVMCWQAVDRAVTVASYLGRARTDWIELRDRIANDVLTHGWNPHVQSFCATYEDSEPDAGALAVGLSGMLPANDSRFLATIDFVERQLREGPTVFRYRYDDGLPGIEGGFHLCTTWLIEAYLLSGQHDQAISLFEQYVSLIGPTGLLSEQYEPRTGRALGNYPQAYSHLGLINAAISLEHAV